jgi:hypothetical protein
MKLLPAIGALLTFVSFVGCSSSSEPGTSSGSTVADGGGTDSGVNPTGACNAIANVGTPVAETANAAALPAMTGGTIVDGTYVLISNVQYAGSSAGTKTHKRTLAISGTTIQLVNSDDAGADVHVTLKIAPSGNALNETLTCPTGLPFTPGTYTATATTLAIQKSGSQQVETYAKQ